MYWGDVASARAGGTEVAVTAWSNAKEAVVGARVAEIVAPQSAGEPLAKAEVDTPAETKAPSELVSVELVDASLGAETSDTSDGAEPFSDNDALFEIDYKQGDELGI